MSRVLGIDPSNLHSAFCVMDSETFRPIVFDKVENEVLRESLRSGEIQFDEIFVAGFPDFIQVRFEFFTYLGNITLINSSGAPKS